MEHENLPPIQNLDHSQQKNHRKQWLCWIWVASVTLRSFSVIVVDIERASTDSSSFVFQSKHFGLASVILLGFYGYFSREQRKT